MKKARGIGPRWAMSRKVKLGGRPPRTVFASLMMSTKPRTAYMVPSVAMKGVTFHRTAVSALMAPTASPLSAPRRAANTTGMPVLAAKA